MQDAPLSANSGVTQATECARYPERMRLSVSIDLIVIPEAAISGYPGPTGTAAPWVPALASLGQDDNRF